MNGATEKRVLAVFLAICGFLFPLFALAGEITGGFPSGSIWLSKTSLVDGDGVQIVTPVYDAGSEKMQGTIVFSVDGASVGSVAFSLDSGETKIVSFPWKAVEGAHAITAEIQDLVGADPAEVLSVSGGKTEALSVSVAAAPPPSPVAQAFGTAASVVQNAAVASLPVISTAGNAVYEQTENLRIAAQAVLQNALDKNQGDASAGKPMVLGAETYQAPADGQTAGAAAAPASFSLLRLLEEGLLFIVSYRWAFYPLLLVAFLVLFYVLAKRITRPRPVRP